MNERRSTGMKHMVTLPHFNTTENDTIKCLLYFSFAYRIASPVHLYNRFVNELGFPMHDGDIQLLETVDIDVIEAADVCVAPLLHPQPVEGLDLHVKAEVLAVCQRLSSSSDAPHDLLGYTPHVH